MRRHAPILPTHLPLLGAAGARRCFPAWIESEDGAPSLNPPAATVLPRVRAALPLRRVVSRAAAPSPQRRTSDARRLR